MTRFGALYFWKSGLNKMRDKRKLFLFAPVLPPSTLPRAIQLSRFIPLIPLSTLVVTSDYFSSNSEVLTLQVKRTSPTILSRLLAKVMPRTFPLFDFYSVWSLKSWFYTAIRNWEMDLYMTCGQPNSCHLIGIIQKVFRGGTWIAHISDPISENAYENNGIIRLRLRKILERKILKCADLVIVTTPNLKKSFESKTSEYYKSKIVFIPHIRSGEISPQNVTSNQFTLVHAGSLYEPRNLTGLLRGIEYLSLLSSDTLNYVKLTLIGDISKENLRIVSSISSLVDIEIMTKRASKEFVNYVCSKATALVTIEPDFEANLSIPSKVVDYLDYDVPQIILSKSGFAVDLLRGRKGFYVRDNSDYIGIAQDILEIFQMWSEKRKCEIDQEVLSVFSQKNVRDLISNNFSQFLI